MKKPDEIWTQYKYNGFLTQLKLIFVTYLAFDELTSDVGDVFDDEEDDEEDDVSECGVKSVSN